MTKLLKDRYNNVVELIQETGRIPMFCIEDGDLEQLKEELQEQGYTCKLDPSTNYLLVEAVRRIWILTDPDNGNYSPAFAGEEIQAQSERFDLAVTPTGGTRDAGHGQEAEFEVCGASANIHAFEDALTDVLQ